MFGLEDAIFFRFSSKQPCQVLVLLAKGGELRQVVPQNLRVRV